MKKLFSISLALLMLLSGLQLTISMHYCGGELADSNVSILGHVASCGMESATDECTQPGNHVESSCCDNKVSVYTVDHNFSPSFSEFKAFSQTILQVFSIPENSTLHSITPIGQLFTDVSPPGSLLSSAVSLPKICVFRIWFLYWNSGRKVFHLTSISCVLILISWYYIFNTLTLNQIQWKL